MRISDWSSDVCSSDLVLIDDAASLPAGDWSLVLVGEHIAAPSLRDALGAHTRLVIMAAQDSDETHRAGLQAGADEVLVKPLALQDLADVQIGRASCRERGSPYV